MPTVHVLQAKTRRLGSKLQTQASFGYRGFPTTGSTRQFAIAEAGRDVVVNQAGGLHEGVADR